MTGPDRQMALRDYFAGKALAAIIAVLVEAEAPVTIADAEECAGLAYEFADAMLEAREIPPPEAV
jgi:hypothetical protein